MNIATPPPKPVAVPPRPTVSGIACLGAVARFHGLEFSDSHLVQVAAPGPNAAFTASSLVQVARKIGLASASTCNVSAATTTSPKARRCRRN